MLGQYVAPKNLCILRLSTIGDVCHAVTIVQNIQEQWPHTQITWICGQTEAELLKGLFKIEIVPFDESSGWLGYLEFRKEMKHRSFDILLHMQTEQRASFLSFFIKANTKIGFDRENALEGQWLFTHKQIEPLNRPHMLESFKAFSEAIGVPLKKLEWDIPITESDHRWAANALKSKRPIAVICPAAGEKERNWNVEGYAKISEYLQNIGFKVVLCGGPTVLEVELAHDICTISRAKITNLVGKTSLKQLLAVLKFAHITVAPDTGPTHMSVAVGTPVVGLYAHTNPRKSGPYLYQKYVVNYYDVAIQKQYGKPYTELPWGTAPKGEYLMDGISVDEVKHKVHLLIQDFYPELLENIELEESAPVIIAQ